MIQRTARIGLIFFVLYLALYGGFVLINAFAPQLMESTPLAGVNLAIWYGFGLIVAALVLALGYGWVCRTVTGDAAAADSAAAGENGARRQ
jgi:uncharacterized membrane protein (DUF485 family)